jgi:hypothetical protein
MAHNEIDPIKAGADAKAAAPKPGADAPTNVAGTPKKARRSKRQNDPDQAAASTTRAAGGKKVTKSDAVLKLLRSTKGTTIAAMVDATGWQAHSVRGFLSGTVKKKMGLAILSDAGKDGVRRYRIAQDIAKAG